MEMLYRLTFMSGRWYALEIIDVASDLNEIENFAREGTLVLICDDLDWFASQMGVEKEDIFIVE